MRATNLYFVALCFFLIFRLVSSPEGLTIQKQSVEPAGNKLYKTYCLTCHQADGTGVRNQFPPLAGNAKITGPSADLIRIVLYGLEGPVTVNGREYNQLMPAQGYLSDKQIADILSFIRNTWGNKAVLITPEEVARVRKQGKLKT
jgi:mono/diheme cytochrome c family protein